MQVDMNTSRAKAFCNAVAGEFLDFVWGQPTRRWVVAFGPVKIPANTTVTVQTQPQCWFKGEKLVCIEDVKANTRTVHPPAPPPVPTIVKGKHWWSRKKIVMVQGPAPGPFVVVEELSMKHGLFIQGLFVGQLSQLPTFSNPIAVASFGSDILDNEMNFDSCHPALYITLQVQNVSAEERTFSASLLGGAFEKHEVDLFSGKKMSRNFA